MITPRENFIRFFKGEETEWRPSSFDYLQFAPEEICENVVRGFVCQQDPMPKEKFGGKGMFGVEWVYEPEVGGSMETHVLFDDIEDWEEKFEWFDLDTIDWEGARERNAEYLKTDKLIRSTIYTGFYERLISFVGFENAAMALIDEDQQAAVHRLFNKLTDFYIDFIGRLKKYFNVELVEFHDDWGTQRSPMFSIATHSEMLVPYMKRMVKAAHKMGVFIEMHSCGMVEPLIPNFIEIGLDTWRGQDSAVNKYELIKKYGDKFKFAAEIRPEYTASEEEVIAACNLYKERYGNKAVWLSLSVLMPQYQLDIVMREMSK